MLAERKKRVKWTLNPRGNSWSQDTNKFGQRMLEKMGWKSGEGLGVNKQGIRENIKVAYKNDNKCLGYKDNGEEWVEHQSQFESLLSELSSSHSPAVDKPPEIETLEQRSRQSRTRVHYQKFTRGKDLSRYSEKDLKCILGKPKVNSADEDIEDTFEDHFNGFYGIRTINSGTMNDYFKNVTKSNSSIDQFREEGENENNGEAQEHCGVRLEKKKKRKTEVKLSDTENDSKESLRQQEKKKNCEHLEQLDSTNANEDTYSASVSKKKHKKQHFTDDGAVVNNTYVEELDNKETCQEEKSKKLKNNSKGDTESDLKSVTNLDEAIINDTHVKLDHEKTYTEKKPKKRKSITKKEIESELKDFADNSDVILNYTSFELGYEEPCREKKCKKKRNSRKEDAEGELKDVAKNHDGIKNDASVELDYEKTHKEKRSKKRKYSSRDVVEGELIIDVNNDEAVNKCTNIEKSDDEKTGLEKKFKKGRDCTQEDRERELKNNNDEEITNCTYIEELVNEKSRQQKKGKKRKNSKEETERVSKNDNEIINDTCIELENENTFQGKSPKRSKCSSKKHSQNEIKENVGLNDISYVEESDHEKKQKKKLRKDKNCSKEGTESLSKEENDETEQKKVKKKPKYEDTALEFNSTLENNLAHDSEIATFDCEAEKHTDLTEEAKLTDVVPTRKKRKKMKLEEDNIESLSADCINDNSLKEQNKKHKKKSEDDDNHNEVLESIKEEEKENKVKSHDVVNGSKEIMAEHLNENVMGSPTKCHKMYSVEEIKSMKLSLFAHLIDPKLIEFKGSNLHTIAGYGNC